MLLKSFVAAIGAFVASVDATIYYAGVAESGGEFGVYSIYSFYYFILQHLKIYWIMLDDLMLMFNRWNRYRGNRIAGCVWSGLCIH